jgi:hypothetical protein
MTDLDHLAGRCFPVTLSNEKASSPIWACLNPHPAGSAAWGPLAADARPIAGPVLSRPGRHPHYLLPRPHDRLRSFHAGLKRE